MRLAKQHEIDTILMTNLDRIGRDALKVLAVLEELDKHGVKLIIQGGDTVEIEDNPLLKYLRRFTPHPQPRSRARINNRIAPHSAGKNAEPYSVTQTS